MSRLGRKPVAIPAGVDIKITARVVSVKGPLGCLEWPLPTAVLVAVADGHLVVSRTGDNPEVRALHGLARAELNNIVQGVTKGFERILEINGVGYKAQVQGQTMTLHVGYTHPVMFPIPPGIEAKVDKQTIITIRGIDKRLVGQVAANLRAIKTPDVYKQKGIKYAGEVLRKKEGKTGK